MKIDGKDKIIETKETLLLIIKYNRGHFFDQKWLFGSVDKVIYLIYYKNIK